MALSIAKVTVIDSETVNQSENPRLWRKSVLTCIFCATTELATDALTYKGITVCVRCLKLVPIVVNLLGLICKRCARGKESM